MLQNFAVVGKLQRKVAFFTPLESEFYEWVLPLAVCNNSHREKAAVTHPSELLRAAARAGARSLGGIHMLVYQGAASFEMWTGREAPVAVMLQAATRAMAAS